MMSEISDKAKLMTSHYKRPSLGRNKCKNNYMARWVLTKYNTRNVDNSNRHKSLTILTQKESYLQYQNSIIQRYAESHAHYYMWTTEKPR